MIAEEHLETVYGEISNFVTSALSYLIQDTQVRNEVAEIIQSSLQQRKQGAHDELQELDRDERQHQPITYNHYFTDNVQKSRQNSIHKQLRTAIQDARDNEWNGKIHISNNTVDAERLIGSLQRRIIIDMDEQACSEALAGLQAYYKVSSVSRFQRQC
jgi:hypothetical protein